ncbi:hypothetical protein CYLTODRAFT_360096 [Cylindrobasidium torrendii FP15055 ss-10]|uniref:Uncharacterized protein n=1 Tax=Cylindrobasidium torrendii FP15055 ss-10 TaxID=1314674 RepID=A0A0D7AZH2_9AGAR|nr:hypothetical protein CYLTODRAFT_360096 [Cylindrobasidium torrendii FP15055 ss-10]
MPVVDSTQYIPLIQGMTDSFNDFIGNEQSDWLLSIAHDLCDPAQSRGILCAEGPNNTWRHITALEPLRDTRYLYELPPTAVVELCKIWLLKNECTTDSAGRAGAMRTAVLERDDDTCWISRAFSTHDTYVTSHICPKTMGGVQASHILQTFCGYQGANVGIFHPMFGITLSRNLEPFFSSYRLGFRRIGSSNRYKVHCFFTTPTNIFGTSPVPGLPLPLLLEIVLKDAPWPGHPDNPPPGLFRWHYLQCVLRHYATQEYRLLPNISYHEVPLPTEGDSE